MHNVRFGKKEEFNVSVEAMWWRVEAGAVGGLKRLKFASVDGVAAMEEAAHPVLAKRKKNSTYQSIYRGSPPGATITHKRINKQN